MATALKPPKSVGRRLLNWTAFAASAIILAGIIVSVVSYITFRAARANDVTIDANGKLVGSFRHVHGGLYLTARWPYLKQLGVLSHGTGGACLLAGVVDPATGGLATCNPISETGTEACNAKMAGGPMVGWASYCAPEGTCWARPFTPNEKATFAAASPAAPFMSCNRSHDPLDPSWPVEPESSVPTGAARGISLVMGMDYPSNAPMDKSVSKKWRVVACVNHLLPANTDYDEGGCSGGPNYGKVLTLP